MNMDMTLSIPVDASVKHRRQGDARERAWLRPCLRLFGVLVLLVWAGSLQAQERTKLGFQLQSWLQGAGPDQRVDLFLAGQEHRVSRVVRSLGGEVKMATPGWVQASLPAAQVEALNGQAEVEYIDFNLYPGHALNDSMRVLARVNEVHQGQAPLPAAYTGKGVLVGIIDTGIELQHPDFQDSLGRTRVLRYWDQNLDSDPLLSPYGFEYGQAWDSAAINAGECPAVDMPGQYGHGSTVAATAAANANGNGTNAGVAPEADLIVVTNLLGAPNWKTTVVDAVRYITEQAAQMNRPVAINLSLGTYMGSHDGLDGAARLIENILGQQPGRVLVCAAGNSGNFPPYHLHTEVGNDTTFTWFKYNANSVLNMGAVYFELWADTADFNNVQYSVGADRHDGGYGFRGRIPFRQIQGTLGQIVRDTLWSIDGDKLGTVFTQAQLRGGQYRLEVYIPQPDSTDQLYYRFMTTGQGRFDVWSSGLMGTSAMVVDVPDTGEYAAMAHYVAPDKAQSIVDSWACSPQVITVGNYNNRQQYVAVNGVDQDLGGVTGEISVNSSRGPSRTGLVKPDLAAPGDVTFGAGPLDFMQLLLASEPQKMIDSLHMRNGGTSIAAPVVAGTAALMLEKCPRSSHIAIRDALISSAFADDFTQEVPNPRFGHGKVDAFSALNETNVEVPLTTWGALCEGDSVMVSGPDFMFRYLWNTGHAQRDIWTPGDTLVLEVENVQGCSGRSDTLVLVPNPLPTPTITEYGHILVCSPSVAYQWYFEGAPIEGANAFMYEAQENGHYSVQVTDEMGCSAFSDSVHVFSVGMPTGALTGLQLSPVPTQAQLVVEGLPPTPGEVKYTVLDAQGRPVQRGVLGRNGHTVDVRGLSSGAYFLRIANAGGMQTLRFLKE